MGSITNESDGCRITRAKEVSARLPSTYRPRQRARIVHDISTLELSKGRGHARPCSIERRHQDCFLVSERMLATESFRSADNDRLPVVELRPFTKKQWQPSKSVPDPDGERRSLGSIRYALCSRSLQFESAGHPDPNWQATITPRARATPCPAPGGGSPERRTQHPPLRECREIPAECEPRRAKKTRQPDHPDGFVSKAERERTTVEEVRSGNSVCTRYSCLKRAVNEVDTRRQQAMRVSGRRMDHLPPPRKTNSVYGDIDDYYRLTKSFTAPSSTAQQSEIRTDEGRGSGGEPPDGVRARMAVVRTTYLDESIYDAFDRAKTLPSIRVRKAPLRSRRKAAPYADGDEPSGRRSSAAARSRPPAYRLGVTNSLHLMSHIGKPVSVEYKLSDELRTALSSLRKNKDSGSIIGGPYKIVPRYELTSTVGESRMTTATQDNMSRAAADGLANARAAGRNPYASRASTRQRSDVLDSGIDSTGGCCSPVKAASRQLDARRDGRGRPEREKPITANIPTDTKGYESSEASGTNPPDQVVCGRRQENTPQDQSGTPSVASRPEVDRTTGAASDGRPPRDGAVDDGPAKDDAGDGSDAVRSGDVPDPGGAPEPEEKRRGTPPGGTQPSDVIESGEGAERGEATEQTKKDDDDDDDDSHDKSHSDTSADDVSERFDDVQFKEARLDDVISDDTPAASSLLPTYTVN